MTTKKLSKAQREILKKAMKYAQAVVEKSWAVAESPVDRPSLEDAEKIALMDLKFTITRLVKD